MIDPLVQSIVAYLRWQTASPNTRVAVAESRLKRRHLDDDLLAELRRHSRREFSPEWEVHVEQHPAAVVVSLYRQ